MLKFIIAVVSLTLGWLFTQLTNYINIYKSDRRIQKETLYFLLELYHHISKLKKIDHAAKSYADIIKKEEPELIQDEQELENAIWLLKSEIKKFQYPKIDQELAELDKNYNDALIKLASVDPINAYKLRGKNQIIRYLSDWTQIIQRITNSNNSDYEDSSFLNFVNEITIELEIQLVNETLEDLREITFEISKKIDRNTHNKTINLSIFSNEKSEIKIDEKIELFVKETFVPAMKKNRDNKNPDI